MALELSQAVSNAGRNRTGHSNRSLDLSGSCFALKTSGKTILLRGGELPTSISDEQLRQLGERALADRTVTTLTDGTRIGRRVTQVVQFAPDRSLRIRAYTRGGLIRFFQADCFICAPRSAPLSLRPFREVIALCHLRHAGINVPRPLFVYISRHVLGCSFRAVIGTEDIPASESFLEYLRRTPKSSAIESLAQSAGSQARASLAQGVFHRDLHPGNVLVADTDQTFLIDFDGSTFLNTRGEEAAASKALIDRWNRFVTKYDLPTGAAHGFREGMLRSSSEAQ